MCKLGNWVNAYSFYPVAFWIRESTGTSGLSTQLGSSISLPGLDNLHGELFDLAFTEKFGEKVGELLEKTNVSHVSVWKYW